MQTRHLKMSSEELAELVSHPRFLEVWGDHLSECEECYRLFEEAVAVEPPSDLLPLIRARMAHREALLPRLAESLVAPLRHAGARLLTAGAMVALLIVVGALATAFAHARSDLRTIGDEVHELQVELNLSYEDALRADHRAFSGSVGAFDLGESATVARGSEVTARGRVRYPRACPQYWLAFVEPGASGDNLVWPRLRVRNTGHQEQPIDHVLTLPPTLQQGDLVLLCASPERHEQFDGWLAAGRFSTPLQLTSTEVVLRTALTVEDLG